MPDVNANPMRTDTMQLPLIALPKGAYELGFASLLACLSTLRTFPGAQMRKAIATKA